MEDNICDSFYSMLTYNAIILCFLPLMTHSSIKIPSCKGGYKGIYIAGQISPAPFIKGVRKTFYFRNKQGNL